MGIFKNIRSAFRALVGAETATLDDPKLLEWLGIDASGSRKAINEATYFTCLKMLSETMGKLPLKFYQQTERGRIRAEPSEAARILMTRPNQFMTPATFWTTVEFNCEHYGNAYVWIQTRYRKSGKYGGEYVPVAYWPMPTKDVTVLIDDAGIFGNVGRIYYRYADARSGETRVFRDDAVMHFKTWMSIDGLLGKSVREILAETVDSAAESQKYLNTLYKSGLSASMALQYTGEIDKAKRIALQNEYNSMLSGAKNAGKVVAVPLGFQLQPIKMSLADAQFIDLRKYTALQIAAAFGIKPNQLNDYEKSSYSNSEMQQLSFLVDTMLYRLAQYEQEINYKVLSKKEVLAGFFFKFNEKAILRTDTKTQMDAIRTGVNNALYTPNEGRELLDRPAIDGGDVLMCNGNYIPVTDVGKQWQKGGNGANGGD